MKIGSRCLNRTFGLAALLALSFGCSSTPKPFEKPEIALESLDVSKATLTDATVLLNFQVRNPNSFKIDIDSLRYALSVNGKEFGSGLFNKGVHVEANGDSAVQVPLRMKYLDLFGRFSDLIKSQKGAYQVSGSIASAGRDFPFEHSGEVKLPKS